jgi:flagellar biosynthetic protein FliR
VQITDVALAGWAGYLFWPLVRVLALFAVAPVFSHRSIPLRAKVAAGVAIALVMASQVASPALGPTLDPSFFLVLTRNILIGVSLGFAMRILFSGVELAGQMIGLQLGLSFSGFFDPEAADTNNPVANVVSLLVMLIFLNLDGHLMLLVGLRESFDLFPVVGDLRPPIGFEAMAQLGSQIFSVALSISLPILAVMLLINIILGIMARVSPQLNLFAVGFPVTLSAGILILLTFLPYMVAPIQTTLERIFVIWPVAS